MAVKSRNKKTTIRIPARVKTAVKTIADKEKRSCESQAAMMLEREIARYNAADAA
jgi:hypothetical protein